MTQTPGTRKEPAEKVVKHIRRRTRTHHSAEEKIRIVLDGLRGEDSIAAFCREISLKVGDGPAGRHIMALSRRRQFSEEKGICHITKPTITPFVGAKLECPTSAI